MSVKPILFNGDMVKAILDGRKTVTRRVIKDFDGDPEEVYPGKCAICAGLFNKSNHMRVTKRPPYQPGDILYVRETWQEVFETEYMDFDSGREVKNIHELITNFDEIDKKECGISGNWAPDAVSKRMKYIVYKADDIQYSDEKYELCWHPSIHMPKQAARIWLKVTNVRVERLQDITWQQAAAEGCQGSTGDKPDPLFHIPTLKGEFETLWNSTVNKADIDRYSWDANPWVWVIEFERCEKPQEVAIEHNTEN